MSTRDTYGPDQPVPVAVAPAPRHVLLPRALAVEVVRVVPRVRLVAPRVYVAVDDEGWPVYVGQTDDELRRLHEHEARLSGARSHGRVVADSLAGRYLEWAWLPVRGGKVEVDLVEEGLVRLLRPSAMRCDGQRADGPTAGMIGAMVRAGLAV